MQTIRADYWTADFQLSRACWEVYQEDVWDGVHVVCLGGGDSPPEATVLEIGDELRRYHPGVDGTSASPVTDAALAAMGEDDVARWERTFLIAIAAGWTLPGERTGVIHVFSGDSLTEGVQVPDPARFCPPVPRPDLFGEPAASPEDNPFVLYPDVAVVPVLATRTPEGDFEFVAERDRRRCRDAVIDGILRLYSRLGHDHTRMEES